MLLLLYTEKKKKSQGSDCMYLYCHWTVAHLSISICFHLVSIYLYKIIYIFIFMVFCLSADETTLNFEQPNVSRNILFRTGSVFHNNSIVQIFVLQNQILFSIRHHFKLLAACTGQFLSAFFYLPEHFSLILTLQVNKLKTTLESRHFEQNLLRFIIF